MQRLFHIRIVRPVALALLVGVIFVLGMSGTAWADKGGSEKKHGTVPPREADLSISKSGRWSGDEVSFTIRVSNKGPVVAKSVVVSDNISDNLSYSSSSSSQGRCTYRHGNLSCALGDLSADKGASITIKTRVKNRSTKHVSNTAHVESATDDSHHDNNTAGTTVNRP